MADELIGPDDELIEEAQADAGRLAAPRSRGGNVRSNILQTLLSAAAGAQAGRELGGLGDPLAAALSGIGAGARAGQAFQRSEQEQRRADFEAAPVERVAPKLVAGYRERFGIDLSGIPVGKIKDIAPLLRQSLTFEERQTLEQQRQGGAVQRAQQAAERLAQRQQLTPEELALMASTTGIPAEELKGVRAGKVPGLAKIGDKYQAIRSSEAMIGRLRDQYEDLVAADKLGPIQGRIRVAGARVTGGTTDPDLLTYENIRSGFASAVKDLVGETGVLTNQDIERINRLLPSPALSPAAGLRQFKQILEIIEDRKRSILLRPGDDVAPPPVDLGNIPAGATAVNPATGERRIKDANGNWIPLRRR